jgi:hypothetical protein
LSMVVGRSGIAGRVFIPNDHRLTTSDLFPYNHFLLFRLLTSTAQTVCPA